MARSPRNRTGSAGRLETAGRPVSALLVEGAPYGAPSVFFAVPAAGKSSTRRQPHHRFLRGVGRFILLTLAAVVWIGAVVYPDPRPLVSSIARLRVPPVDAQAVGALASLLPDDYKAIEEFSLSYVRFAPAWDVYGLPWYFPTVAEVVRDGVGDCQARAILLASILEAKGMPYTMHYSFEHVWVDYPGKEVTDLEDPDRAFISDSGQGWLAGLPDKFPLGSIVRSRVEFHWTPMPLARKVLIVMGLVVIMGWGERRFFSRLQHGLVSRFIGVPRVGEGASEISVP
jgi:hypothetical protein